MGLYICYVSSADGRVVPQIAAEEQLFLKCHVDVCADFF